MTRSCFSLPFFATVDLDVRQRERREQHLRLRRLEPLGERVGPDHDQLDLHLAALLELRLHLAHVRLEGPAEHVHLEDARGERVLDGVVDLLAGHAPGERPDRDRDLLLLGLRHRVHEPGRALDRRVLAVEAADHLDVVLELRCLADARLADDVALPVLDGVAAEGHDLEGAADSDRVLVHLGLIDRARPSQALGRTRGSSA